MPTYEYRCDKCNENFELFQKFIDKPLRRHPECGGNVEKVFHSRGVVFKGSGFYSTDSRVKASASSDSKTSEKKSNGSSSDKSASSDQAASSDKSASSIAADKAAVTSSESKPD